MEILKPWRKIFDLIQFMQCTCKNESKVLADSKIIPANPEQPEQWWYCVRRAQSLLP